MPKPQKKNEQKIQKIQKQMGEKKKNSKKLPPIKNSNQKWV